MDFDKLLKITGLHVISIICKYQFDSCCLPHVMTCLRRILLFDIFTNKKKYGKKKSKCDELTGNLTSLIILLVLQVRPREKHMCICLLRYRQNVDVGC